MPCWDICIISCIQKFYPEENSSDIWDFSAIILIAGIFGARLYFCMLNPIYYFNEPLEILNFREGGLSIHGGLAAGIGALIVICKKRQISILKILDAFSCGTALAQSIGRWGNFFNSEAFGAPTNLPWKLFIPPSNRPMGMEDIEYFHPTFLYESLLDIVVFFVLLTIIRKFSKKFNGLTFFSYLILYSTVRFFVEGLRIDSALNICGIPFAQVVSALLFITGGIGITVIYLKNK